MFGCIAAGRPVHTNLTALSATQFTLPLPYPANTLNHLVVFLLPETLLPPGTAATVYIHFPTTVTNPTSPNSKQTQQQAEWKLLGAIGNDKPSAIFRVRGLHSSSSVCGSSSDGPTDTVIDPNEMTDDGTANMSSQQQATITGEEPVTLGISIEPIEAVQAQLSSLRDNEQPPTTALIPVNSITPTSLKLPPPQMITTLARRIIKNCFNYLASFEEKGRNGQNMVPLRAFQEWWTKFEKRVEYDPSFLEREE